jgi:dipeptidase E
MKRILLFSLPYPDLVNRLAPLIFPAELNDKKFAYMPSDGADPINEDYNPFWKLLCKRNNAEFIYLDNSKTDASKEIELLAQANILMITGGNTYTLLRNLKRSGLDKAVQAFAKKEEFVISGFSAGAVVLTPTMQIVGADWYFGPDSNDVGLSDLAALNILDFEILPHFNPDFDSALLEKYSKDSKYEVKTITDTGHLNIEL